MTRGIKKLFVIPIIIASVAATLAAGCGNAAGPDAGFSAEPNSGTAPLTVRFTDESTGDITARVWLFGDGETSTRRNPSHTYETPGAYTVSLTVTGPGGSSDTEVKTDYIT